ncbi:MAG TPA: biotin/lipoyl-containing protein, partial [Pseudomonadales bacterium]
FEPAPGIEGPAAVPSGATTPAPVGPQAYNVRVNGRSFTVEVSEAGVVEGIVPAAAPAARPSGSGAVGAGRGVPAPLAGTVFKLLVAPGDSVAEGQPVIVLEAMKMETEVSAPCAGSVVSIDVEPGDAVAVGDVLLSIG